MILVPENTLERLQQRQKILTPRRRAARRRAASPRPQAVRWLRL